MYKFRSRDRRLAQQTARDIALSLQRDYFTFSGKKSTEISNRYTLYGGYLSDGANAYPNVLWVADSEVDWAFNVLETLLVQLASGTYQSDPPSGRKNPSIWPVSSISWQWIQSLYASVNPDYASWLTANNITVPPWSSAP
jgi:hypothetical protein